MADWFEDDDFWRMLAPNMFHAKKLESSEVEAEDIIATIGLRPPARVLDLPCGWGRHSIEFAKRGFAVTAVDRNAEYLDHARSSARETSLSSIEFVQDDMRRFSRPDLFDAALCMFTSMGYFESREENVATLANYHRNLKPGGALVLEMMGKEVLARTYRSRDWSEQDGVLVLQERELLDSWSRIRNTWTIIQGTERRKFTFTHWLYSAAELREMLAHVGFARSEFFADLKKTAYDQNADRLVALAWK